MLHNQYYLHEDHNNSIQCNVTECRFHDKGENFCTLEQINVTKHEKEADTIDCTDCGSFMKD